MGPALLEGRTGILWQPLLLPCTCRSAAFSGRAAAARGTSRCRRRAQRSGAGAASPAPVPLRAPRAATAAQGGARTGVWLHRVVVGREAPRQRARPASLAAHVDARPVQAREQP